MAANLARPGLSGARFYFAARQRRKNKNSGNGARK